jgi:hypothetical protein
MGPVLSRPGQRGRLSRDLHSAAVSCRLPNGGPGPAAARIPSADSALLREMQKRLPELLRRTLPSLMSELTSAAVAASLPTTAEAAQNQATAEAILQASLPSAMAAALPKAMAAMLSAMMETSMTLEGGERPASPAPAAPVSPAGSVSEPRNQQQGVAELQLVRMLFGGDEAFAAARSDTAGSTVPPSSSGRARSGSNSPSESAANANAAAARNGLTGLTGAGRFSQSGNGSPVPAPPQPPPVAVQQQLAKLSRSNLDRSSVGSTISAPAVSTVFGEEVSASNSGSTAEEVIADINAAAAAQLSPFPRNAAPNGGGPSQAEVQAAQALSSLLSAGSDAASLLKQHQAAHEAAAQQHAAAAAAAAQQHAQAQAQAQHAQAQAHQLQQLSALVAAGAAEAAAAGAPGNGVSGDLSVWSSGTGSLESFGLANALSLSASQQQQHQQLLMQSLMSLTGEPPTALRAFAGSGHGWQSMQQTSLCPFPHPLPRALRVPTGRCRPRPVLR